MARGVQTQRGQPQLGAGTEITPGLGPPNEEVLQRGDKDLTGDTKGGERASAGPRSTPTVEQVVAWAKHDIDLWADRNDRMKDHQERSELRVSGDTSEDEEAVVLNDPLVLILKLAGMLAKQPSRIDVVPRKTEYKDLAEAVKNALTWMDVEQDSRRAQSLRTEQKYEEFQSVLLRGWLCARVAFNCCDADDDGLDPHEYMPVTVYLADPALVYPNSTMGTYTRVTHQYEASVGELLNAAELDEKLVSAAVGDREDSEVVRVTGVYEYSKRWNYHCVLMGEGPNAVWLKKPTPMDYMPWVIVLAGGMFYRWTPWDTNKEYTKHMGVGILHSVAMNQDYLNRYVSMLATMVGDSADPFIAIYSDNAEDEAPEGGFKRGGHKRFGKETKLDQLTRMKDVQHTAPLVQIFQDRQERGTIPRMLYGGADNTQGKSGYLAALYMAAAYDVVFPYIRAWELFKKLIYRKELEIFKEFAPLDRPLMVLTLPNSETGERNWMEFYPHDVSMQGTHVNTALDPLTIQDKVNLGQLAVMLVREGIISPETARGPEFLRLNDPQTEERRVMMALARKHPLVIEEEIPKIAEELGDPELAQVFRMATAKLRELQAGGGTGAPGRGPGGSPGGGQPGRPAQVMGRLPGRGLPGQVSPAAAQGINQGAQMLRQAASVMRTGRGAGEAAAGGGGGGGIPPG